MNIAEQLTEQRVIAGEQAKMQKLSVKGHLLIGTDLSAGRINNFLIGLGEVCKMNIFNGPHVKTPNSYDAETFRRLGNRPPEDINGAVMWDDSGAQMYVFPDKKNWFTLEVYTCKEFDYRRTLTYTYQQLGLREDMMYSTSTAEAVTDWRRFVLPNKRALNPEIRYLPAIDLLFDIDYSDPKQVARAGLFLRKTLTKAIRAGHGIRVADSYTTDQVNQLQKLHGNYEVAVDNRFIDNILSGQATNPDQYPFQETYDRLSFMEANAAGLKKGGPVIHIGTGWPGTAVGLYRQFGIPVTCVEKDHKFAQRSKEGLERLGLLGSDKLQVVCADGSILNPEGYSAVIVSAMVPNEDKNKIVYNMRQLATGWLSDPLLILRTPADRARALFYQELDPDMLSNQWLTQVSETTPFTGAADPLKSLVFRVMEMSAVRRGEDYQYFAARVRLQPARSV